jgi:RNA polymerase sigma-70 factor, ECF subfamily
MAGYRDEPSTARMAGLLPPRGPLADGLLDEVYAMREQLICYMTRFTHDREQAEDLVQEGYARLLVEVGAGRVPSSPRAWLYRVCKNLLISTSRRRAVAARATNGLRLESSPSAEDHVLLHETEDELLLQLRQFCWVDRTSLLMAAQGYSRADIARVVGCSTSAVRTRICRARLRLRIQLDAARMTSLADR